MNNINIDNLHQSPKSARAVCKVLEQIGIKGMELWKNRYNKHYVLVVRMKILLLEQNRSLITILDCQTLPLLSG